VVSSLRCNDPRAPGPAQRAGRVLDTIAAPRHPQHHTRARVRGGPIASGTALPYDDNWQHQTIGSRNLVMRNAGSVLGCVVGAPLLRTPIASSPSAWGTIWTMRPGRRPPSRTTGSTRSPRSARAPGAAPPARRQCPAPVPHGVVAGPLRPVPAGRQLRPAGPDCWQSDSDRSRPMSTPGHDMAPRGTESGDCGLISPRSVRTYDGRTQDNAGTHDGSGSILSSHR
jgi:hypothetical protein